MSVRKPIVSVQVDVGVQRRVFAGVADTKDEFAGIDGPFVRRLRPSS